MRVSHVGTFKGRRWRAQVLCKCSLSWRLPHGPPSELPDRDPLMSTLGCDWPLLSLLGYSVARHKHRDDCAYILGRISDTKQSEP
jgi:hypothetical protein